MVNRGGGIAFPCAEECPTNVASLSFRRSISPLATGEQWPWRFWRRSDPTSLVQERRHPILPLGAVRFREVNVGRTDDGIIWELDATAWGTESSARCKREIQV